MAKKLLCVVISMLMIVSLLPVGVFAVDTLEIDGTTYEVIFSEDCSIAASGWGEYSVSSSAGFLSALQTEDALVLITRSNEVSSCTYENIVFVDSWWGNGAVYGNTVNYAGSSANVTTQYVFDTGIYVAYDASEVYAHCNSGGSAKVYTNTDASYTITNISVVVASVGDYTVTVSESENGTVIADKATANEGDTVTLTVSADSGYALDTITVNGEEISGTSFTMPAEDVTVVATFTESSNSGFMRLIYVNEEYHGLVLQRGVRRYLISIPHTLNAAGYCTGCGEYIGTGEAETVTIGDVEYEVVYSNDANIKADNWNQVDLGDLELIEALSQDGAVLVITRDTETVVSFDDGEYEKFLLIDSWWSNGQQPVSLGTAGHTSADEDVIDCTSDDGITVMYDGATIYSAWVDGGYAEGGSELVFISNTSASYKISNIQVLVPVE